MSNKIVSGLPLSEILDELLGSQDCISVSNTIAQAIALTDKDEAVHVQFKDLDTGKLLVRPIIWWKHKWLADVKHRTLLKEQCAYDNHRLSIFKENTERVTQKLMKMTGLPRDRAEFAARQMVLKGDWKLLENLGIYLEEIPPQREEAKFSLDLNKLS